MEAGPPTRIATPPGSAAGVALRTRLAKWSATIVNAHPGRHSPTSGEHNRRGDCGCHSGTGNPHRESDGRTAEGDNASGRDCASSAAGRRRMADCVPKRYLGKGAERRNEASCTTQYRGLVWEATREDLAEGYTYTAGRHARLREQRSTDRALGESSRSELRNIQEPWTR